MTAGIELVRVRKGRGRVHVTASAASGRPVRTLCGKELSGATVTEDDADCNLCVRRQHDSALVSVALFNDDRGEDLLEASLEAARRRREGRPDLRVVRELSPPAPSPERRAARRRPQPPEAEPEPPPARRGELDPAGLRPFSDDVYVSPGGGIVRMDGERVAEVTAGTAQLVRTPGGLRLKLGDLRVTVTEGTVEVGVEGGQ